MTKKLTAFALAAMLAAAMGYADDAARVANDPFTVTLPAGYAAFTKQVQTAKSPEGEIEMTNWIAKAPTGEAVVVTLSRMPAKILDPQKLITSTRASLLKSLGATLESEEADGLLRFHSNAAFFQAKLTVLEDRVYQVLYVGRSAEQRTAPGVGQIFESFRIADTGSPQLP